jgi:hypothetical protein
VSRSARGPSHGEDHRASAEHARNAPETHEGAEGKGGPAGTEWPPAQAPALVRAARTHLTSRFARGVEALLWDSCKRPLADTDAITAGIQAAEAGVASGLDMAAALVSAQALRLDVDGLEYRLIVAAQQAGLGFEEIAAVLDLPSAEAAKRYYDWLSQRAALPVDEIDLEPDPGSNPRQRAERAGRRAGQAAERARKAGDAAERARLRRMNLIAKYGLPADYRLKDGPARDR